VRKRTIILTLMLTLLMFASLASLAEESYSGFSKSAGRKSGTATKSLTTLRTSSTGTLSTVTATLTTTVTITLTTTVTETVTTTSTIDGSGSVDVELSRLHTDGRWIKDSTGNIVRLKGAAVFWRFIYSSHYHDYDPLSYNDEINETSLDTFKSAGANFIRLELNGWIWYVKRAPKYVEAVDKVISWCKARKIMVVLDNHQWYDMDSGFMYKDQYALATQLTEWKNFMLELAERYKNEPTVIGFDMLNEPLGYPHNGLDWNTWRTNVLEVIRAVHAVDPTYLCFVEPLGSSAEKDDMNNFKTTPLPEPNIVYSAHIYYAWDYPYQEYAINYGRGNFELAKQQMEALYYERFLDMLDAGLPALIMETGVYRDYSKNPNWEVWISDSLALYEKYNAGVCWLPSSPDRSDSSLISTLSPDRSSLTDVGAIWAMYMNSG